MTSRKYGAFIQHIKELKSILKDLSGRQPVGEYEGAWPKITVVTPNFNGAKTLRRTIESIIHQGYPNLEYIIVDGGSTDESHLLMEEYSSDIAEIIIGRDRTMYDAVAKGFDRATGDILAWLNSDDAYEPGILLKVGALFALHPDWSVIYFDDNVWKQGWRVANRLQKFVGLPELLQGHVIYQASTFFRRSAYETVGGLEREALRLAGDYQLWVRLAAHFQLHFVSGQGSSFCIRNDQLSGDWNSYLGEMASVKNGALAHLPRFFSLRTLPSVLLRRLASRRHRRSQRCLFELRDEGKNWSPVIEPSPPPISTCRCPVCRRYPERLLFSTPDTHFGDRTVRMVYYCASCELAFIFPFPTDMELTALYERSRCLNIPHICSSPPETYSPFQVPSLLASKWGWWCNFLHFASQWVGCPSKGRQNTNIWSESRIVFDLTKHAAISVIGIRGGRLSEWLQHDGYSNLYFIDLDERDWPAFNSKIFSGSGKGSGVVSMPLQDAIILDRVIGRFSNPVGLLENLSSCLGNGGRVYIAMPNLDSAWINQYGPSWHPWNFPYNHFVTGKHGLQEIARRAGYRVEWIRTATPIKWIFLSDILGCMGLGGYVSPDLVPDNHAMRRLWQRATGAALHSRLCYDRRNQGDCLFAGLVKT
jgi:O-antigen biosynthesis protein